LPKGGLAWAIEKVDAPDELMPLVRRLLRDVVIVPDLAAALELKKHTGPLQYATLGGEFISADGIIFGGSTVAATDSLLGRKAVLTSLAQERESLEAERQTLIEARDQAQAGVEAAIGAVEDARNSHETAQQNHSQASVQILSAERAVEDAEQKLAGVETEKSTLEQQIRSADERIVQLETELGSHRKTFEDELEQKRTAEQARENARAQEEEAAEKLNELRLAVATERQRHESLVHHRQPMAAREAELADLVATRRRDIATYQNRLTMQAKESEEAEAKILSETSELGKAGEIVTELADDRRTHLAAVNEQESRVRTLRDSLNDLRDLRGKQEVRQTQLQLRIENLAEHVARRYQIDLRTFTTDAFAFQKTLSVVTKRRAICSSALASRPLPEGRRRSGLRHAAGEARPCPMWLPWTRLQGIAERLARPARSFPIALHGQTRKRSAL
jgi:chromosome segregation protein